MFFHIMNIVLCFIEGHPVLVGMIIAALGACWLRKYRHQKRVDACVGFYANVLLLVDRLHKTLDSMHRLDDTSFNIFSLHYTTDVIRAKYKGQVIEAETIIPEKELYELRYIAAKLQNVLMDAQNNINPQKVSLDEWYGYQHIILDLCALILGEYNLKIADENDQTPNDLCREAQTAIKGIVESIRRAQTMTM